MFPPRRSSVLFDGAGLDLDPEPVAGGVGPEGASQSAALVNLQLAVPGEVDRVVDVRVVFVRVSVREAGHPGHVRLASGELDEPRSEEHTSELQSLMRISSAFFCFHKKK